MSRSRVRLLILTPDDWSLFRELRLAALREAPDAFSSTLADWQDAREARWRERLTNVPFNAIAFLDGAAAGMVGATGPNAAGTVELISMWVAPFARGRGVGDALVKSVAQWAAEKHAREVTLEVVESNGPARALYERCGFADQGRLSKPGVTQPERWMRLAVG